LKFEKKEKATGGIPTASLPDIIFMLLIFFMVATVFKEYRGLSVVLPKAKKIEKLPGKRDVAYLWVDRFGRISVDDKFVNVTDIAGIMYAKRIDPLHPLKVVSMRIDKEVEMGLVIDIQEELRKADALNVNYSAKPVGE
jgi:biopolymer transport protein ExbD